MDILRAQRSKIKEAFKNFKQERNGKKKRYTVMFRGVFKSWFICINRSQPKIQLFQNSYFLNVLVKLFRAGILSLLAWFVQFFSFFFFNNRQLLTLVDRLALFISLAIILFLHLPVFFSSPSFICPYLLPFVICLFCLLSDCLKKIQLFYLDVVVHAFN